MELKENFFLKIVLSLSLLIFNPQSHCMLIKKNVNQSSRFSKKPISPALKEAIQSLGKDFDPEFKTIPVKSTDEEIINIPVITAKKSMTLSHILQDLNDQPPIEPIPIPYPSLIIKEVISDVQGISLDNGSLNELVQKFDFLSRFDFPSNIIDQSLKEMTSKIKTTNLDEIIKSKEIINTLDPNIPNLHDFFINFQQKINTPFMTVEASKGNIIYIPESVAMLSDNLKTRMSDIWQQKKGSKTINLSDYSAPLLADIFSMIEKKESVPITEHIKNYSLDKLIKIVNCLDFLSFREDIPQPFYAKISSLSKEIPLSDPSYELFRYLAPGATQKIFIDPLTKKLQHLMVKRFINERYADVSLSLKEDENLHAMAFSPNNTTFVFAIGKSAQNEDNIFLCNIDESRVQFNNQPIINGHKTITSMTFSPDGKLLVTGCLGDKENLFVRKVHQNNIESNYQALEGHFSDISNILFHPSGNAMISASQGKEEKLATKEAKHSLLLWKIENGKVQSTPMPLSAHRYGVDKVILSTDGSMMISMNSNQKNDVFIWNFDKNGQLIGGPKKLGINNIQDISFIPNSKTLILFHKKEFFSDNIPFIPNDQYMLLSLCDMNFPDIGNLYIPLEQPIRIEDHPSFPVANQMSVSPDGSILFSVPSGLYSPSFPVDLFSIVDHEHILFNTTLRISLKSKSILCSKDSNTVAFLSTKDSLRFTTLFTKKERSQLNKLGNLNALQALHIDRLLDIQGKQPTYPDRTQLILSSTSELRDEVTNYEKLDLPIEAKQLFEKVDIDILPSLKQNIKKLLEENLASGDLMSIIRNLDNKYKNELERKTFIRVIEELGLSYVYLKHHKESPEFAAEKLKHSPEQKEFARIKEDVRKDIKKGGLRSIRLIRALKSRYENYPKYQKALKEVLDEMGLSDLLGPTPLERILDKLGLSRFKKYVE